MCVVIPIELYESLNHNKLRIGYIILIASLIKAHLFDEDIQDYLDIITTIEKSCYDDAYEIAESEMLIPSFEYKDFEELYRTRIVRITKNLDINSEVGDDHLMGLILECKNDINAFDLKSISKKQPEELNPSKHANLLLELNSRRNQSVTIKVSTLYKCRKCFKNKCTTKSIQMRSLDEGETTVVTCVFCGHKWFV